MDFKEWRGQDLTGTWLFTIKIDGIQGRRTKQNDIFSLRTKNQKPIYHLPPTNMKKGEIFEVYCGSWNDTMSIVRASKSKRRDVRSDEVYQLYPRIDRRLRLGAWRNPKASQIRELFAIVRAADHEGLVLRQGETFIKVKEKYTVDVKIQGLVPSTAKSHPGALKEFITEKGKVGAGFTIAQRKQYMDKKLIGTYIEVEVMEITKNGKWRHPRFVRLRPDK